jgi:YfiH family protein
MIDLFLQFSDRIECHFLTKEDDRDIAGPHVRLWQVHGNRTVVLRESSESTEKADGVITDTKGLHLTIRAADCQNFAIYDPVHHVGGVLHAGWKGLIAGAIPEFFTVLHDTFGIEGSDCFVVAGPSLCRSCAGFSDPKTELPGIDEQYIDGRHVDLQQIATDQLVQSGLHIKNIERHPDCTRCCAKRYYTYRGGDKGKVESGVSNILVLTLL